MDWYNVRQDRAPRVFTVCSHDGGMPRVDARLCLEACAMASLYEGGEQGQSGADVNTLYTGRSNSK